MKSSISFGALATALLAFSIVSSQARAEDLDAMSCLPPTVAADNSAEVAEAFEVACLSSRTSAQTFGMAQVASPSAIGGGAAGASRNRRHVARPMGHFPKVEGRTRELLPTTHVEFSRAPAMAGRTSPRCRTGATFLTALLDRIGRERSWDAKSPNIFSGFRKR
jgi:hypothetical protein